MIMSSGNEWATETVCKTLESFIARLSPETQSELQRWDVWKQLLLVCLNQNLRPQFLCDLSQAQINSIRVLLIWKSRVLADLGKPNSGSNTREVVDSASPQSLQDELSAMEAQVRRTMHEEIKGEVLKPDNSQDGDSRLSYEASSSDIDFNVFASLPATNGFDVFIQMLVQLELKPYKYPYEYLTLLHEARDKGAEMVAYRKLLIAYLVSRGIINSPENNNPLPVYLALEKAIANETGLSSLGWSVQSCPWFRDEPGANLPYYLWDSEDHRTVETKDISQDGKVRYAVVSHTWGRWRIKDALADMRPRISWLVPENTKFDVRSLPSHLELLCKKLSCRYVWFDLLCIPQDRSDLAKKEIARQATIFKGATVAISWQNETEDWTTTQAVIRWLTLQVLRNPKILKYPVYKPGQLENIDPLIDEDLEALAQQLDDFYLTEQSDVLTEDLITVTQKLNEAEHVSLRQYLTAQPRTQPKAMNSSWFTSLWTLQEAFMRGDMIFVSKGWEVLTIDGDLPISLDALLSLASVGMHMKNKPKPVSHLIDLLLMTNMTELKKRHRVSLLATVCARQCEHSRTEAIMSMLGATQWQKKIDQEEDGVEGEKLVLGRYDYRFLQEIIDREGFVFFSSQYWKNNYFAWARRENRPVDIKILNIGSAYALQVPHPSLRTWKLLRDGSVRIRKVGILYANFGKSERDEELKDHTPNPHLDGPNWLIDVEVKFICPPLERMGDDDNGYFTSPLKTWMDNTLTDSPKYAVYISDGRFLQGFVLKELDTATDSSPGIMAKVADFSLEERKLNKIPIDVPSSTVNWLVY
ncbi:hypothetical protein F4679DRAFT_557126 [Xylaria curta]|nr:hypothetical protein F4679DRAFT_557126 [Xylaria curta]